jgi:hypothetical protein
MASCIETNELFQKLILKQATDDVTTDVSGNDCKTVRVFISSTFKDFYNEREVLVSGRSFGLSLNEPTQGILSEGEGSIHLTSLY